MPFLFSPVIRNADHAFFAAMNTPKGFLSSFSPLFSPYRQYIIKGGPGTGKSTLMKKIAANAEARGLKVTYYFCSSDTASLDAVVIPALSTAFLDGTAPHAAEPELFGVKDRYLDLSQFLRADALPDAKTVAALVKEKQKAYKTAYTALAALSQTDSLFTPLREEAFDTEKCQKALARLIERLQLTSDSTPYQKLTPISAIGSEGYLAFDSYARTARLSIAVADRYGAAPFVFQTLFSLLDENKISYYYSLSPITLSPDTVYLPQKDILLTSLPLFASSAVTVNCERFLKGRGQGMYKGKKAILAAEEALLDTAKVALARAAAAHREAEAYYIAAMDFDAMNAYTDVLVDRVLSS